MFTGQPLGVFNLQFQIFNFQFPPPEIGSCLFVIRGLPIMSRYFLTAAAAVLLCVHTAGQAAKVKVWHHSTPAHFEKARLKHAVISSEGALRLSRQLKPLAALEATHVWDVVEDRAGNLLVATGDEGKIYKVTPDGKVTVAFACED